ncbi:class I SAM-dependent methyltransferase [Haloarchaeobius salinus]|uniref:class I SAM-dependent methyltransferase n=1 Tax=Haloarchaeobius salinus TaxID=1198298 RepID=UPI0021092490|nr:class I SAM-dependent methyltransferase [Haloarchaeobius salinus]
MPHVPNLLERLYVLRGNRAPGTIYDLLGSWTCKTVVLAAEVGVFEALSERPGTASDLAVRLDCDPDTLGMLCTFLARAGYLDRDGETYHLSGLSERWLVGDASLVDWFTFWDRVVYPFWDDNAETVLRTGAPEQSLYAWLDDHPELWAATQRGFEAAATVVVDPILDAVDLAGDERVLDVGGGHGRYAIAACERHPGVEATVVDDPLALAVARENAADAELDDRVSVRGADLLTDDLGGGNGDAETYDVAFVFNVVHGMTPAENERLLASVADALAPGGRVVVVDQFADTSGPMATARSLVAFIGFSYRVLLGGRAYPYAEVADWLGAAGFVDTSRTDFRRAPGVSMATGRLS